MNQPSSIRTSIPLRRWMLVLGWFIVASAGAVETRYVEGDVIVTFKNTASLNDAKRVLAGKSLAFARHFAGLSDKRKRHTGLVHHDSKTTAQLIAELKNDPNVESVEPNYLRWVSAVPNDARFNELWALQNTGQSVNGSSGSSGVDIKFVGATALARPTSKEVVVAVIDTGVDFIHPDLAANMWVNKSETRGNNTDDDANGYTDDIVGYNFVDANNEPLDSGDHGTHVAGTIAAVGNNQAGVIGVGSRVKIMALRVSSNGTSMSTAAIISALQYATAMKARGVNIVVINASYGGGAYSSSESAAIKAAGDAGIVFCAAAGNEGANNDSTPTYPASYRLPNMIVVAATDRSDTVASFSNYGATSVDIAAPGVDILSTKPSTVTVKAGIGSYTSVSLTYAANTTGVTGTIYDCGIGNPADFPTAVRGNIALIARGTLFFSEKVTNAMAAGATAAIIYNNVTPGTFNGTLQNPGDWIPARAISQADGLAIKALTPVAGSIDVAGNYQFLEGTSMATPHVAGAVAFEAMNFPGETVAQRIARILNNADVKPSLQGKVLSGGRLNLLRTIDANQNGIADWLETPDITVPTITSTTPLHEAVAGLALSQTLTETGGTGPFTWTVNSGSLPAGLTLGSDGTLSGTPTATGTSTFDVLVTDANMETDLRTFSLTTVTVALSVTTTSLPNGMTRNAYNQILTALGGSGTKHWSVSGGALPTGLTLSSTGGITGTPAVAGTFDFTVKVADDGGGSDEQSFTVVVDAQVITIANNSSLSGGTVSSPYSVTLNATGGNGGYVWSVTAGMLPHGLTLSSAGVLSGTPTATGTFDFTANVIDNTALSAQKDFEIVIDASPFVIAPDSLLYAVKGAAYSQTLSATGGDAPYAWSLGGGALPGGLTISSAGVINGKPLAGGTFQFIAKLTDSMNRVSTKGFSLYVSTTYLLPVLDPVNLGPVTIGQPFSARITATNYPTSFSISGLPAGVTYVASTGVISGRPLAAGTFTVSVRALNPAGGSVVIKTPLVVSPLTPGLAGSFTGIIDRDATANASLGGRLTLTVATTGAYTAKVSFGARTLSGTGYLAAAIPQVSIFLGSALLQLNLDTSTQLISGTHGGAAVRGWRSTWIATTHPATTRIGYYSAALDLADHSIPNTPQGFGYVTFSVTTAGILNVVGRTPDGQAISSAGFIGPNGEIAIYTPLYANLGSIAGTLTLADHATISENSVAGDLSWMKPANTSRSYGAGFGPLTVNVFGKYLASSASGKIVLGLPAAGTASLSFADGGLSLASIKPDVSAFTYTSAYTVVMPVAGGTANPGRVTLAINKNTGAVTGRFTLKDGTLIRIPTCYGMIVRLPSGTSKAVGYFLVAQIPLTGQTINTSPILSGSMQIDQ